MSLRRLVYVLALFIAAAAYADAPGVYAITGGTVHPVSGPEIANGVVVIRGGLIEAVGVNVPIPADATVIDVKGGYVYPGLIDAQTSLGFASAAPRPRGRGAGRMAAPAAELPETSPAFLAVREAKISDDDLARSSFILHRSSLGGCPPLDIESRPALSQPSSKR